MTVIDKLLAVVTQTLSLFMPFAALRLLPERWTESPTAFGPLIAVMLGLGLLGTSMSRLSAAAVAMKLGLVMLTFSIVALALTFTERLRVLRCRGTPRPDRRIWAQQPAIVSAVSPGEAP